MNEVARYERYGQVYIGYDARNRPVSLVTRIVDSPTRVECYGRSQVHLRLREREHEF